MPAGICFGTVTEDGSVVVELPDDRVEALELQAASAIGTRSATAVPGSGP